ncbi:phosphatase PAP2 family protein [Stappia indica]|uniref:Phosphatase PAP2 family protein n=1 Tax=Stappia indica TaxID=538381 RepID=A0A857C8Q9_9HYPH|nr:phosphatase PAP2 family protein [Stappia indica]
MTDTPPSPAPSPAPSSAAKRTGFAARLTGGDARALALAVTACLFVLSLFFLAFPAVDIAASRLFHDPAGGFVLSQTPFLQRLRELGPFLVKLIAVLCVAILLWPFVVAPLSRRLPLRAPVFLLSTLILGPGLLVNAVLKNNWGRPRPNAVDLFGGDAPYVRVWQMTNHCDTNCSFVSGEASSSLWLVTLAFLAPPGWRRAILAVVLPLALVLSANRVAFGGHFLSDTLISWCLTLLVILGVHYLLWRAPGADMRAARWRNGYDRAADTVRARAAGLRQRLAASLRAFAAMMR